MTKDAKIESESDIVVGLALSMVDGVADVGEIGELCGLGGELAKKIFGDLRDKGLVTFGAEASAPPREGGESGKPARSSNGQRDPDADVDEMLASLEEKNFYDVLGVAPDADRKEMRTRYFTLSKKFHPDKAFGKDRAQLRKKMEVVFRRISQAYETLSNTNQRREYDAYIADQIELWRIERQLQNAMKACAPSEPPAAPKEPPATSRPSAAGGVGPSHAPGRTSSHDRAGVRVSMTAAPSKSAPPARRSSSSPAPRDPSHQVRRDQWKRERLSRALSRVAARSSIQPAAPAPDMEDKIKNSEIAMEQGAYGDAADILQQALTLAPDDKRLLALMNRAKAGARRMLATGYLRQGMYERRGGDLRRARGTLEKALEADPLSPDARHLLAQTLLDLRQELPRALTMCRELVHTSGHKGRYFATLGELLLLANENEQAAQAFEKAVQLEPGNKDHKKRLKACKA